MKTVVITHFANDKRKYANYKGQVFTVYNSVDNCGDYCIMHDKGQPFMFIAARDCKVIRNN